MKPMGEFSTLKECLKKALEMFMKESLDDFPFREKFLDELIIECLEEF